MLLSWTPVPAEWYVTSPAIVGKECQERGVLNIFWEVHRLQMRQIIKRSSCSTSPKAPGVKLASKGWRDGNPPECLLFFQKTQVLFPATECGSQPPATLGDRSPSYDQCTHSHTRVYTYTNKNEIKMTSQIAYHALTRQSCSSLLFPTLIRISHTQKN